MNPYLNSIGIDKKNSETTVVVAMSGGVDSSTVAGMMKKEGFKVIGITLKLYDDGKEVASSKQCCSGQDIMDAKRVAHKLDIEHKILYYQNKFKQGVIDNFVESYLKGETPIPCVQCNQTVKFKDLFAVSKDLNADALVTGHYVKSITNNSSTDMYRAVDENRDQSYFLFSTTKEQLNFLRFPLGGMLKNKTRAIAKNLNLNVVGLMCIPPENKNPQIYFKKLSEMKIDLNLQFLSMGMTADYVEATGLGSTHLRIGSKIFGKRN